MPFKYKSQIRIDEGRINYELDAFGAAIVGVPSDVTQQEIDDAFLTLRSKYSNVDLDVDGDIVINAQVTDH